MPRYLSVRNNLESKEKHRILSDLVRYTVEMEQGLQHTMELLLPGQEEATTPIAANQEEMKGRQHKEDAEAKTRQDQLKVDIKCPMEAFLEELRSCEIRMTACHISSVAYPKKPKARPGVLKVNVDIFEERSSKMEATDLGANQEATDAVVLRQELL
jgi:hypothetical protein